MTFLTICKKFYAHDVLYASSEFSYHSSSHSSNKSDSISRIRKNRLSSLANRLESTDHLVLGGIVDCNTEASYVVDCLRVR